MLFDMLLFAVAAASASPAKMDDRQMVAKLDTEFQYAVKVGDIATIERILHPEYKLVLGSGRSANYQEYLTEARSGTIKFEIQDEEPGSQSVLVVGDTAIVTAKLRLKGTREGKPFDRTLWFSDTYVKTKGNWRYLFGQASLPLAAP